jgi:hypothetical protein
MRIFYFKNEMVSYNHTLQRRNIDCIVYLKTANILIA